MLLAVHELYMAKQSIGGLILIDAILDISSPTNLPKLGVSWSFEQKFRAIKSWVYENFDTDFDVEIELPDGTSPKNYDELHSELFNLGTDSEDLLKDFFGDFLFSEELKMAAKMLDTAEYTEWYPCDERISFEVDFLDEGVEEFDELKSQIPDLRASLSEIKEILKEMRGHNGAPDEVLGLDKVEHIDAGLARLQTLELGIDDKSWVQSFAQKLVQFGKGFADHLVKLASVSTLKFAESFGEKAGAATGSWSVRLLAISYFGEKLLRLFS